MPEFVVIADRSNPLWTHRVEAASAAAAVKLALFRQLAECWRRGADFEVSPVLTIRPPGVAPDSEDELFDWAEMSLARVVMDIRQNARFPAAFARWAEDCWNSLHRHIQASANLRRVRSLMLPCTRLGESGPKTRLSAGAWSQASAPGGTGPTRPAERKTPAGTPANSD